MRALFLLHDLLSADARPPDLQTDALVRSRVLSGPIAPDGPDVLVWVEQDTGRVYATEIVDGQLATRLVGQEVSSILALADYDGDGQRNIIASLGGGLLVDAETWQTFEPALVCDGRGSGDVNEDGFEDIASPFGTWLGSPDGFYAGGALSAGDDVVSCPTIYPLGDIDTDGRGDFARASVSPGAPYAWWPEYGPLDLYLGSGYSSPNWAPTLRYTHPTEGAGRAVTAADTDGDGYKELVVLSGHDVDGAVRGELQILDNIFDPLGPTVVVSEDIGWEVGNHWGVALENLGDLDGDGDDEVLSVMENFLDGTYLRIIDAEPTVDGLSQRFGDSFDLPLPEGTDEGDTWGKYVFVGDYDGDGRRDVAMLLTWETPQDEYILTGTIAVWLSPEVQVVPSEPATDTAPAGPDALEPPVIGYSCGCGAGASPGALWVLLLPLLALRSRAPAGPR